MIIIEAGGTSTKICQILSGNTGEVKHYKGISPSYMSIREIISILDEIFRGLEKDSDLYYYGTGCFHQKGKDLIRNCLKASSNVQNMQIESDLLAAARATAASKNGQVNILGTGSASCTYVDDKISELFFNSGYLFGDYGSGYSIGKAFLSSYFQNELDSKTEEVLVKFSGMTKNELLQSIYKEDNHKTKIASYAKCVYHLKEEPQIKAILLSEFQRFITHQIKLNQAYNTMPQYFAGSVAYHFQNELKEALAKEGLKAELICQSPIHNLIEYHLI